MTAGAAAPEDGSPREAADAATRRARRACRVILAAFVFVSVWFVGKFPGHGDSNQRSHYQALRALAERGDAEISPELRDLGTHTDVAVSGGRRYPNKAPGLSVAAVPGYALMRLFLPAPSSLDDWLVFYGARVLSVTLAVAIAAAAFARLALRRIRPARLVPLWLFALLFATPFHVYARSFFSHAFAGALLFGSFALLESRRGALAHAAAGALAAAAVASEYPVAVIALCLAVFALARGGWRGLLAFAAGALPPAAALAAYHARYFGGVLHFPPSFSETYSDNVRRGIGGIGSPSLRVLAGLFLDPSHGLLYFSPFLAAWPVVALASLRRLRAEPERIPPAVGPLLLVILISGYFPPHWRGGWCLGPRYIVAGFVLVAWLLAVRVRRPGVASLVLAGGIVYGAAVMAICGSTMWLIPFYAWNPARTLSLYLLRRGIVGFNLGVASGMTPWASLVPPALATAAALAAALRAAELRGRTAALVLGGGLLAAAAVLSNEPSRSAIQHSQRDRFVATLAPSMRPGWR